MKPLIEFCVSNLAEGSQKVKEKLEKDPNIDVIEYGCLGYCGKCGQHPFVLVDGEIVMGEDNEELLENIYKLIKEHQVF